MAAAICHVNEPRGSQEAIFLKTLVLRKRVSVNYLSIILKPIDGKLIENGI